MYCHFLHTLNTCINWKKGSFLHYCLYWLIFINLLFLRHLSSCRFNFRTFRWAQTMLFAIKEINARNDLLPKTDLGYVIYDSCFTISKAVEGTLTYLTGQDEAVPNYRCGDGAPLAALVGAGGSDLSIATARILGLYHFPQVSLTLVSKNLIKLRKMNKDKEFRQKATVCSYSCL